MPRPLVTDLPNPLSPMADPNSRRPPGEPRGGTAGPFAPRAEGEPVREGRDRPGTILHVISDFTRGEGAQTMLARLLGASPDEGAVVASLRGVSDALRAEVGNPRVRFVALGLRSPLGLPSATVRLARTIRAERPRAILCWMYHAMPAGLAAAWLAGTGTPVFWTVRQALDDPASLTASTRRAMHVARRLSPLSSGILYNSQRGRAQHVALGFADSNAVVVPNGFPLPPIAPPSARRVRVFGVAGRSHPQKDHETFFKAAAKVARALPDARFVLAGAGMCRGAPEVEAALARAGLPDHRVDLRGRVEGMADFYEEIDVLVLSSRTEGFPNVVAEAMSFGRPVIATDVGDAAAIVGNAGIVVPPGQPDALAEAMLRLAQIPPDDYRALGAAARARIERTYALPVVAAQYRDFLVPPHLRGAAP